MNINNDLTVLFIKIYNEYKEKGQVYIPYTLAAQNILLLVYNQFVKDGSITKIEYLDIETKMKLVDECRKQDIVFTNESLTNQCRILHLFKVINDNT